MQALLTRKRSGCSASATSVEGWAFTVCRPRSRSGEELSGQSRYCSSRRLFVQTICRRMKLAEPAKLSEDGRLALEDPQNEILFSAASIWEIALKKRIGRINFAFAPGQIARAAKESGFAELPVFAIAAALVEQLPLHHRDPFDHLLIAQAMSEPARLFTADPVLARYSELVTIL
jgi:PIN domain nuclease of toxin-antitoxin system